MSNPAKPSGVITITTDFGHQGPFVGVMKGCILTRFPEARIVDLTHEIVVHWPAEAGFWLARAFEYFPAGTVHIAVVDPGVGTSRDIVAVAAEEPSATFHGRDIFAPIAAELAAGRCTPADLGPPAGPLVPAWVDEPTVDSTGVTGVVMTIDHFGNLISNIDGPLVSRFRQPLVQAGNHTFPLLRTYGDAKPGDYLALVNSFGVLEIARAEQSAAEGLGLSRGAPIVVREGTRRN
jgi:S-adenosylmethionine hydrolase